jgi:LacI family transcriptional regulator
MTDSRKLKDVTGMKAGPADGDRRKRGTRPSRGTSKLADVARLAGVSTATASRALNAPHLVSNATRERVTSAIRHLNWIPHGAAKALASLRTHTVGALIPTLGHQTIAAMLEALQGQLNAAGYTLLLGRPDPTGERATEQAAKMIEHGVEGMILFGEDQPQPLLDLLRQRDVFCTVAYTSGRGGMPNCIGIDNFAEMQKVVEHVLGLGHTRIGLITRPYERNDRIRQRVESVNYTLARQGLAVRPQHIYVMPQAEAMSGYGVGAGRAGLEKILAAAPRVTAVICTNDYLALGALIEARAQGIKVPNELTITGFDDVELAVHLDPPLTTVRVPARRIGEEVGRFVIERLNGAVPESPLRIEAELLIRGSSAPPQVSD